MARLAVDCYNPNKVSLSKSQQLLYFSVCNNVFIFISFARHLDRHLCVCGLVNLRSAIPVSVCHRQFKPQTHGFFRASSKTLHLETPNLETALPESWCIWVYEAKNSILNYLIRY